MNTAIQAPLEQKTAIPENLRIYGSFALIQKSTGEILVTQRHCSGLFDLPGGGVKASLKGTGKTEAPVTLADGTIHKFPEREEMQGESWYQAAQRETLTEIGFDIEGCANVKGVGAYQQIVLEKKDSKVVNRHIGFAYLHRCTGRSIDALSVNGLHLKEDEVIGAEFMPIEEILERREEFSTGALRMICRHYMDFTNEKVEKNRGVYSVGALKNPVTIVVDGVTYVV